MINKKIKRFLVLLISIFLLFNCSNKVFALTVPYSDDDGITSGWKQGDHSDEKVPAYIRGIFSISDKAAKEAFNKTVKDKNYVVMYCKPTDANTCALNVTLLDQKTKDADGDTIYYADPNDDSSYKDGLREIAESADGGFGNTKYFPVLQVGKKKGKEKMYIYHLSYEKSSKKIKEFLNRKHDAKKITKKYKKLYEDADLVLTKVQAGNGSGTLTSELKKAVEDAQKAEKKAQDTIAKKKTYELTIDESLIPKPDKGIKQKYAPQCSDVAVFTVVWKLLFLIAPFLVVIFGSLGMFKAVIASDENKINEEKKKLPRRLIAFILLLITPWIVRVLVHSLGSNGAENTSYVDCIVSGKMK